MAFLGTLLAAIVSVPFAFLAAKNTFPFRLPRFGVRRLMDCLRGIDQLIWALIFVRAVGLGPLAGIMAIFISDVGTLSKLFSESIENIERKPMDGVRAMGAGGIQTLRFGVLPQVLPMFLSSTLYMFEFECALGHHSWHRRRRRHRIPAIGPDPGACLGRGRLSS